MERKQEIESGGERIPIRPLSRIRKKEKVDYKENETITQREQNFHHAVAGFYSAGGVFKVLLNNVRLQLSHPRTNHTKKRTDVCEFAVIESLHYFILRTNSLIYGPKTLEYLKLCQKVSKEFIVGENKTPSNSWLYGFMCGRIIFYRDLKANRDIMYMHYPDKYVLDWFQNKFGGSIVKKNNGFKWILSDKKKMVYTLDFLLSWESSSFCHERLMQIKELKSCLLEVPKKSEDSIHTKWD